MTTNLVNTTQGTTDQTTDISKNQPKLPAPKTQARNRKLPVFLLTNIQSFGNSEKTNKTTEIKAILDINNVDVAIFTEAWLTNVSKDNLSMNNYVNFHFVRKNMSRASGGITILVNNNIPSCKLDIDVPEHIECLWITMRPKWLPRAISNIIVAGIYYPGSNSIYAPKQEDILLHITDTVHRLYKKYAKPLFVLMGDFNDLCVDEICDSCDLSQIVKVPTRKNATLDLILTNNNNDFYKEPISLPKNWTK